MGIYGRRRKIEDGFFNVSELVQVPDGVGERLLRRINVYTKFVSHIVLGEPALDCELGSLSASDLPRIGWIFLEPGAKPDFGVWRQPMKNVSRQLSRGIRVVIQAKWIAVISKVCDSGAVERKLKSRYQKFFEWRCQNVA